MLYFSWIPIVECPSLRSTNGNNNFLIRLRKYEQENMHIIHFCNKKSTSTSTTTRKTHHETTQQSYGPLFPWSPGKHAAMWRYNYWCCSLHTVGVLRVTWVFLDPVGDPWSLEAPRGPFGIFVGLSSWQETIICCFLLREFTFWVVFVLLLWMQILLMYLLYPCVRKKTLSTKLSSQTLFLQRWLVLWDDQEEHVHVYVLAHLHTVLLYSNINITVS